MKKELKIDVASNIKRLRVLTNRLVNTNIIGGYRSSFRGRGLEFFDYRHYTTDDDASSIDWKASVKSKELLVKEFVEERNLNVFFLIDVSSSMLFGSLDKLKVEYAAEIVATLSYTILQAGDSISFAFFTDKIVGHEPPKSGFKQYYKLMQTLVDPRYYGGNYDIVEALKFTMAFLKEFSIVIIVSDFIGLKNDWQHYIRLTGKKYDLIGIMIHDPNDEELPDYNGQVIFGDVYSDKHMIANVGAIRDGYAAYALSQEKEIVKVFTDSKADFIHLKTDEPFIKPITDLFLRRAKKIK